MERPILFTGDMVRAVLDGRKTQTRRVVNRPIPVEVFGYGVIQNRNNSKFGKMAVHCRSLTGECWAECPYGQPGDQLWVRETFRVDEFDDSETIYRADFSAADLEEVKGIIPWKPSIFMPRSRSRILLEVTDICVERVQDISDADAKAEGVFPITDGDNSPGLFQHVANKTGVRYKPAFSLLWDSINENRGHGWDVNPWVWVVEFKVLKPAVAGENLEPSTCNLEPF